MISLLLFIPILAGSFSVVLAAPITASLATSSPSPTSTCQVTSNTPITPDKDCFYRPPQGWESKKRGTVLLPRSVPKPPVGDYIAHNILYRTTDSNEKPTYAVTTLVVPKKITKPHSLISYQHYYDSADVNDSPTSKRHGRSVLSRRLTKKPKARENEVDRSALGQRHT